MSITRQCELLEVTRSGYYYSPRPTSDLNLELMRKMDEHLEYPFKGEYMYG